MRKESLLLTDMRYINGQVESLPLTDMWYINGRVVSLVLRRKVRDFFPYVLGKTGRAGDHKDLFYILLCRICWGEIRDMIYFI